MSNHNGIRAFDYIQDNDDWIYVVRAVFDSSSYIVAHPIYTPRNKGRRKIREQIPSGTSGPGHPRFELGSPTDYLISHRDIEHVFPREGAPLIWSSLVDGPLKSMLQVADGYGARTYLFGSRRLGMDHDLSDWDILVDSPCNITQLLSGVHKKANGIVQRLDSNTCEVRARRYAQPNGCASFSTLLKILPSTTIYISTHSYEIGIFAISPSDSHIAESIMEARDCRKEYVGTITRNGGYSHLMPRRFCLRTSDGLISISTLAWELGGLEEAEGITLRVSGLRQTGNTQFWLGGSEASVEVVPSQAAHVVA